MFIKNGCCQLKKQDVQLESCELSFIWGKMRTAAWETAPQTALRNRAEEAVGEVNGYDVGEGEFSVIRSLFHKRFSASHKELMSP